MRPAAKNEPAPRADNAGPQVASTVAARAVTDTGAFFAVALAYLGDRLGLFRALAEAGPSSSADLAARTGLDERYVREWLKGMAAAEYVEHDAASDRYQLTPEQVAALADESSPTFVAGAFQFAVASLAHIGRVGQVFRAGGGIPFAELGDEVTEAIDRLHRPSFVHQLAQQWLPGVPGLAARLAQGIDVLDVGCGLGRSTLAIAGAYPRSRVVGLDPDPYSVGRARELAAEAGIANARFVAGTVEQLSDKDDYQLILAIDCIHDMADPVGVLVALRRALTQDGLLLWIEPAGSTNPLENRNPIGRMRATLSLFHCLTVSLAQGGPGLGTLIGESGVRELANRAGFPRFEKLAIQNPMQQFFALSG